MKDIRAQAAKAIGQVLGKGESFTGDIDSLASKASASQSANRPSDDKNDRGFYRELCFGTLRHFYKLDAQLQPLLKKPFAKKDADIHALLLIGLYQIQYMRTPDHAAISASVEAAKHLKKIWAKGLVNAVLRNFLRQQNAGNTETPLADAAAASHPQWLFEKLKQDWPDHWQNMVEYNNSPPPMAVRINRQQQSREQYQQQLAASDITSQPVPYTDCGLMLDGAVAISQLPDFEQGVSSVQDPGAQLAASLLNASDKMRVLDACSAPGGKAIHILEIAPKCSLLAIDSSSDRLLRVEENIARHQQGRQHSQTDAAQINCLHTDANNTKSWWDGKAFDRILLDAPCSGTGIISHHPDIKLLRRPGDINTFAKQQMQLLNNLWPLLASDGELLYCTCSIMPEENARLIDAFLAATPKAKALPIECDEGEWGIACGAGRQLLPNRGKNGGFFYARLSKSATV